MNQRDSCGKVTAELKAERKRSADMENQLNAERKKNVDLENQLKLLRDKGIFDEPIKRNKHAFVFSTASCDLQGMLVPLCPGPQLRLPQRFGRSHTFVA